MRTATTDNAEVKGYTTRFTCRVCGSEALTPLFSLGTQYVSTFLSPGEEPDPSTLCPIDLELCRCCSLVQMKHTAPQELLYSRHYWYVSSVTETMRKALRDVAACAERLVHLNPGDDVLDIGSNDGCLLRSYHVSGLVTIGVEPADNLVESGRKGISQLYHGFWPDVISEMPPNRKFQVVTATGMFYDSENPRAFIEGIAKVLSPDGVFIAQLMCLQNMINVSDVGNFAHEHLEYYSLRSLEYLFGKYDLEIFDIETNTVNGESYRLYVRHRISNVKPFRGAAQRLVAAKWAERNLHDTDYLLKFFKAMQDNRDKVLEFLVRVKEEGKRVFIYGASTKANVICQWMGIDSNLVEDAVDRSPEKWGKRMVGSNIPIVSNEEGRKANPDYFLIMPFAFTREFVALEHEWLAKGGRFCVPLPQFHIL